MGHDLSLPFRIVKSGRRAVFAPDARASEKMVPTIEGEWARKRRMMAHGWPIVIRGGLLDPRGYPPLYAAMVASHRLPPYGPPVPPPPPPHAFPAPPRRGRLAGPAAPRARLRAGGRRPGRRRRGRVRRRQGAPVPARPL